MPFSIRAPIHDNYIYILNFILYTVTLIQKSWFHSRKGKRFFFLPCIQVGSGPTQPIHQRERELLPQEQVAETRHSPPFSAEFKNQQSKPFPRMHLWVIQEHPDVSSRHQFFHVPPTTRPAHSTRVDQNNNTSGTAVI
jgi:hypothetical protein